MFNLIFATAQPDPCSLRPCQSGETCIPAQNRQGFICRPPPSNKLLFF